ncbi:MAG: GNAT family protein [Acidimicrobiales bacterium]
MWSRRSSTRAEPTASSGAAGATLIGRRVVLRPLAPGDFDQWREVRTRCEGWLTKWEPQRIPGTPDTIEDRHAFAARCGARTREIQMGSGYGFGMFVDGYFAGEINVNSVHRGPFQSAYIGYWIDERHAGQGYTPEALVLVLRFAFEQMMLHRLQVSVIPRNQSSRRVAEKLGLRNEGIAERYLEINGVWEDHVRYAITAEEWTERRDELLSTWAY